MAGALKVVFGLGYGIYYGAFGALGIMAGIRCVLALKANHWRVAPFAGLLSGLGLEKRFVVYLLSYCAFFLWLLLTTLWSAAPEAMWKEDFFYICVLLCVVILTGLCITNATAGKFLLYWVAAAVIVGLYVITKTMGASTRRDYRAVFRGAEGNARLTLALPMGAALANAFFRFYLDRTLLRKSLWFVLLGFFVVGLGRSSSRGPLIFSLVSVVGVTALYLWHYPSVVRGKAVQIAKFIVICVLVVFGLFYGASQVPYFAERLDGLLSATSKYSTKGRIKGWQGAWNAMQEAPVFGNGLGMNAKVAAPRPYPHNLFLQVGIDGGFVAVGMLGVLIFWPIVLFMKRFHSNYNDPVYLSLFAVLIFLVLEFSKSYDFYTGISLIVVSTLSMKYLEKA